MMLISGTLSGSTQLLIVPKSAILIHRILKWERYVMTKLNPGSPKIFRLGAIALMIVFPSIAMAKPLPLSIDQKIHNFETILSRATKGKPDEAALKNIRKQLDDAEDALKANDPDTAEKLYSQAWEAYQSIVRIGQTQGHKASDRKRLAAKTASTRSLLKQLEEIDKGKGKNAAQIESVKSLLAQAEATEDTANALALANQAYYTTEILLRDARNGNSLEFNHTFATPALKYADELADNDSHFGLLDIALEQLHAQADTEYNDHVNDAKKLRKQAEEDAMQNNHEAGVHKLELSTRSLKKALQHIGLPVPGI